MTTRSDVITDFRPSPRVATVLAPSVEITVQDTVDTLRISEETFRGMSEFKLLDAAGKEDLGGGVQVGITTTLQDTQIAFEGRTDPAEVGTVTTDSSAIGNFFIDLIDTNAEFQTNEITRGSLVINFTDQSIAEVYQVMSETRLLTRIPVNGTTNTFTTGDDYQVFNVIQCEISGGNLVAVDGTDETISPILPTAFTQVVRTASSSATLINNNSDLADAVWDKEIDNTVSGSFGEAAEISAYGGQIHLDQNNGQAGTDYPIGTEKHPVNNIADAVTIGNEQGIDVIHVAEDVTVFPTDNIDGFHILGSHTTKSEVTLLTSGTPATGPSTEFSKFSNCSLVGTLDGWVEIDRCSLTDIFGLQAVVRDSILQPGSIQLAGNRVTHFLDCNSGVPGLSTPELDFGAPGSSATCTFRGYKGGIKLTNKDGPESVSVDLVSGQVIVDSTVTDGLIVVRGVGLLFDNSPAGSPSIVNSEGLTNPSVVARATWEYDATTVVEGSFGEVERSSAFSDGVWVNTTTGTSGTAWPQGTSEHPVDNVADALTIAIREGKIRIRIVEDATITSTDTADGFQFEGSHASKSEITVESGASVNLSQFTTCTLTGTFNGTDSIIVRDSIVSDVNAVSGIIHRCALDGTIQLGTQPLQLLECSSVGTGTDYTIIDFNSGLTDQLSIRAYRGPIQLINKTGSTTTDVDFDSGSIVIESTCTAGEIIVRGIASITDSSGAGCTVNTDALVNDQIDILTKYSANRTLIDETTNTLTVFEEDGVTVFTVFDLKDDAGVGSVTSIFERDPQ